MFRAPPRLVYIRWLGALCSTIPMLFYFLLISARTGITMQTGIYGLTSFFPLIIFGYFLDLIYKRIPKVSTAHNPIVQILSGWLVAYPLSQVIGHVSYYLIMNDPIFLELYTVEHIFASIISFLLLGAMYGFFFYAVYMVFLRWYLLRKFKPIQQQKTSVSKKEKTKKQKSVNKTTETK